MKYARTIALVTAGLLAGLILGTAGLAFAAGPKAAPNTPAAVAQSCVGAGLKMGQVFKAQGARMIDTVAKLTGLSAAEVTAQRQSGKSLAEIAKAKGVTSGEVVAKTLAQRKAILDQYVKDGRITAAQAKLMLDRMSAQMKSRVDSTGACQGGQGCGQGGGCGMGRGQGGGCQGGGCGAAGTTGTGATN